MKKGLFVLFLSLLAINLSAQDFHQKIEVVKPEKYISVWSAETIVEYSIDSKTNIIILPKNYGNVQYNVNLSSNIKLGDVFVINGCNAQSGALIIIKTEKQGTFTINSCYTQFSEMINENSKSVMIYLAKVSVNNMHITQRLCIDAEILKN